MLIVLMMGAMLTFARKYSASLADAIELEMKLAAKAQALEEALRQKTSFISGASHDLRQPVHAMGLFVELLRNGQGRYTPSQGLDYLARSLRSLRDMLSDMLHVSKLDADQVEPVLQHFRCGEMLQRLRDEYAPIAAAQGLSLRCRGGDRIVVSDPALLERMLRNLLSNALKFTSEGGVALLCRGAGTTARLQVVDTGIGIPAEDCVRVFHAFTRLDDRDRDDSKGLGLGLAIVQRLALLMGHRVSLASRPGHGSTFTIELAQGDARRVAPQRAALTAAHELPAGEMVLIVDDDAAVRTTTAALFEQWGLRPVAASSTASALSAIQQEDAVPALLVVDLHLGGGESGLTLIAELRDRCCQPFLPAILVSGDATAEQEAQAQRSGIVLLRKPVDPLELERDVRETLFNGAG